MPNFVGGASPIQHDGLDSEFEELLVPEVELFFFLGADRVPKLAALFEEPGPGHLRCAVDDDRRGERTSLGGSHSGGELAIYRGWMMSSLRYGELYHALWDRGYRLINSVAEYHYCHELPQWYRDFSTFTPKTMWFEGGWSETIPAKVKAQLGDGPYIVKDFVKSQKHYWKEACFIEGPSDIERITKRFIELQEPLQGGLVFRDYVQLERVGRHPKSGTPIMNEVRYFVTRGRPILAAPYWSPEEGGQNIELPSTFDYEVLTKVKSEFFTMDIARLADGSWIIVELGDGQVAGLPPHADVKAFYKDLASRFL